MKYFRAYRAKADGFKIPTYFIESTAPDNVDDTKSFADADKEIPPDLRDKLESLEPFCKPGHDTGDEAVKQIAEALANGTNPNLVVMVHGFNNPEPDVLSTYARAAAAVNGDSHINGRDGLVCVGYRWPSEKMGTPLKASWSALPILPTRVLYAGIAFVVLSLPFFYLARIIINDCLEFGVSLFAHLLTLVGWILAGLILMAVILRAIVYFRDNYRASNYGVPDLIQIIRAIDQEVVKHRLLKGLKDEPEVDQRIELSFIGHSMGGFVVTNTIRTLVDVFDTPVDKLSHFGADAPKPVKHRKKIGKVFQLKRFVLVSPDIPAETLLSNRGNFLASALSRFDEAYLFSNEGDEVLRQISTLANYFVFPTKSNDFGFRLGNVEILSSAFGVRHAGDDLLDDLRVGNLTLRKLYDKLQDAEAKRHGIPRRHTKPDLPGAFTYFDCTDYVEPDSSGKGLLTFALCLKLTNPAASLRWRSHLRLLYAYLFNHQKPNVHGGYFEGALSQQLIYRLACLGYRDTITAFQGEPALDAECKTKQIRVLVSAGLNKVSPAG
jgi:hypothetical protein